MLNANLNDIKNFLETENYNCAIIQKSKEIPVDQLLVWLSQDSKKNDHILVIRTTKQDLSKNDKLLGIKSKKKNYQELQLIVKLPFNILDAYIPDLARLILILNKGMELPGFELSEIDRLVFYRHAFVISEDALDKRIMLSLMGMITLLLDTFTETLEAVAIGSKTLQQIVDEVSTQSKKKS